ncbi:MAG TPA: signal peptidase II [Burkholderiaceae bacterium]
MARSPSRASSSSSGSPSLWIWLGLALAVVLLDQFVKQLIAGGFAVGESRTVTSFFNVVRWHNTGAAFSFLADSAGWQRWFFVGLALAASAFIVLLLKRHAHQTLFCFAVAMVMGGAVGNALDRIVRGYVVDFISLHWHDVYTFPAFNLADSAITLGAVCLLLDELRRVRKS